MLLNNSEIQQCNAQESFALASALFSNEEWVKIEDIKLRFVTMPKDAKGIPVAKSKLPINKQEELDFIKEVISAMILVKLGYSVILIPKIKRSDGKGFLSGPDAIVNGKIYEFKEVVGTIDKIGARFTDSRIQADNVYIRVSNPKLTKSRVIKYMSKLINGKDYNGGYQGTVVFTFGMGKEQQTYLFKIQDFKK